MKKTILYFLLVHFLFCWNTNCISQQNDAALWAKIRLEKLVTPRILIHFKEAVRIGQNFTQPNYAYSDIGLTFKINKNIYTSLNYRFTSKRQVENFLSIRHRFYFTLSLKKKIRPICIITRFILLSQFKDIYTSEEGMVPQYYLRSKVTVRYDLNRFSPYEAAELITNITRWSQLQSDRYRLFAGCKYEFNKFNELDLYYMVEKHINQENPITNYVVGIGYTHRFY
ncbi:MAG: DUF2490 domain-containing protein [Bacteroidetes bacterium]|nr:DUF2490 domain-containing protein [Bacteroidota bacterium]